MGVFDFLRRSKTLRPDQQVLAQLQKAGSNLSKPHAIEFFLYFPTQSAAERAANRIREMGFSPDVRRAAQVDSWLCFATKEMIPSQNALESIRSDFSSLAASLGGDYDGWGTPVVP